MSAKTNNLEKELERLGLVYWQIGCRKVYCSVNAKAHEGVSYLVRPYSGVVDLDLRRKLACYADQVGWYVKFSAVDMHTNLAEEVARSGPAFLRAGVVAIFYPKFPYSQVKKVMREIQGIIKKSFGYYQEDADCLKKLQAAKTLEKDVLSISKVDTDYLVYTGSEELHPLTRVATLVDAYVKQHGVDESEDHRRDLNAIILFGNLLLHVPYPQYVPVGI
jgi:hypothetical protein